MKKDERTPEYANMAKKVKELTSGKRAKITFTQPEGVEFKVWRSRVAAFLVCDKACTPPEGFRFSRNSVPEKRRIEVVLVPKETTKPKPLSKMNKQERKAARIERKSRDSAK